MSLTLTLAALFTFPDQQLISLFSVAELVTCVWTSQLASATYVRSMASLLVIKSTVY